MCNLNSGPIEEVGALIAKEDKVAEEEQVMYQCNQRTTRR
jgi:hypothetical protein